MFFQTLLLPCFGLIASRLTLQFVVHRSQVLAFKTAQDSRRWTCCTDFTDTVSLVSFQAVGVSTCRLPEPVELTPPALPQSLRRLGYGLRSARQVLQLWQGTMKEIGGTFGSSVLSYFLFLKWLLLFNLFSFVVNFGFITIPLLVFDPSPNVPANVSFRGLEFLTGAVSSNSFSLWSHVRFCNHCNDPEDIFTALFVCVCVLMYVCVGLL